MDDIIYKYVSRETIPLYEKYIELIKKWNRKTGLVQENTLSSIWHRHILDCLQIIPYISDKTISILDIGTGGGFPGIVLSIAGYNNIHLCESNIRKCVFLEEVIRQLNLSAKVINSRVEKIDQKYNVIVSRACASLDQLLSYMFNVSRETNSIGIFLKGKTAEIEIESAQKEWDFNFELSPSITSEDSKIIIIKTLQSKGNQ
jgi:16S rRNA (guanine527-N7)-methyltransferase